MTPEQKIYNIIRDHLIEKHGEEFLLLPLKDQNTLIWGTMKEYVDNLKSK